MDESQERLGIIGQLVSTLKLTPNRSHATPALAAIGVTNNMVHELRFRENDDPRIFRLFYRQFWSSAAFRQVFGSMEPPNQAEALRAFSVIGLEWSKAAAQKLFEMVLADIRIDSAVLITAIDSLATSAVLGTAEKELTALMDDQHEEVAVAAAQALAKLGTRYCVEALENASRGVFRSRFKDAARASLEHVLSRLSGEPGSLSLTTETSTDGQLSITKDEGGLTTVEQENGD